MDDRVDILERLLVDRPGRDVPLCLARPGRRIAHEAHDVVPGGGEGGRERGPYQAGRARDAIFMDKT